MFQAPFEKSLRSAAQRVEALQLALRQSRGRAHGSKMSLPPKLHFEKGILCNFWGMFLESLRKMFSWTPQGLTPPRPFKFHADLVGSLAGNVAWDHCLNVESEPEPFSDDEEEGFQSMLML